MLEINRLKPRNPIELATRRLDPTGEQGENGLGHGGRPSAMTSRRLDFLHPVAAFTSDPGWIARARRMERCGAPPPPDQPAEQTDNATDVNERPAA